MAKPNYKKLQRAIAQGDGRTIEDRWAYGRTILDDPKKISTSGKSLRHGAIEALIADARAVGSELSEQEIQRRLRCARTYKTIKEIRRAVTDFGTWHELVNAGFPPMEVDDGDPVDALEEVGIAADAGPLDDWHEDPLFEIPGFKPVLKIRGRKTDLADLTVRDAVAYRDMCREMHQGFGRTVVQIEVSVEAMLAGSGGDLDANAVEAWKAGTES